MTIPGVLARMRRQSLPLLLLCAAVLPLLMAAEAVGRRSAQASTAVADTTVLFGPRQFNATNSGALYVEQFTTTLDHAAQYRLEVTNGTAGGTNRVTNGQVKLNGTTVVSALELQNGGHVIPRVVWLADGANTVQVEAAGNGTRYLSVRVLRIIPEETPLYRHGFRKTTSAYTVFHDTFATPRAQPMPGRLYLEQKGLADSVFLNGQRVYPACVPTMQNACFALEEPFYNVSLQAVNALRVEMGGAAGTAVVVRVEAVDTMAPVIALTTPAEALVTREGTVTVAGTVTDDTPPVLLTIDGDTVPVDGGTGAFSHVVPLPHDGTHTIQIAARDAASPTDQEIIVGEPTEPQGNEVQLVRTVVRDAQPPALALSAPADGAVVDAATVLVQGSVTDATALTVNVNGIPVTPGAAGAFAVEVALVEGANFITASATDAAGNASTVTRQVTRSAPPALAVSAPLDGAVTQAASVTVQGTATGAAPLSLTLNGSPVALGADGAFSQNVALAVGANVVTLVLTDGAGRTATATRSVTREQDVELPPDPATVAPAPERGVATDFAASNAFLYTGSDPIQTGVAPGTIEPRRVGVVRGRVLTREGAPLSGVRVSVLGHPELGQTLSRADGMFDLAANGGGELTLNYEKAGVLPAQRPVQVDWQRFTRVDDVRLVTLDTAVTQVNFSQPAQVARGSVVADADGPRRATLVFRQGTSASLEMPDGTLVPAASLSIRATEYTVGADGRAAMPGPLPPSVAYTYAVELSADEALAAGAVHVRFDQPVSVYVDNFLGFPAGTAVPAAWFDRTRGLWIPQDDGRVITVLSVDAGTAAVDVNGDGAAEGPASLAAHGFDAAELTRLATLYTPGTTLWRVQTTHFSPFDYNWPAGPDGPGPPDDPPPGGPDPDDGEEGLCPGVRGGSIIECQTRVLGERVGLVGAPYSLVYRSDRVPGRAGGRSMVVRLTGDSVSQNLLSVRLEVQIAGRWYSQTYQRPGPDLSHTVEWDGKDAYGRRVQGREIATVRRIYQYLQGYMMPAADSVRLRSFGLVCQGAAIPDRLLCFIGSPAAQEQSRRLSDQVDTRYWVLDMASAPPVGLWDGREMGLGGWTLDVHHAYDPRGRTLYRGDGTTVPATPRNGEVHNVVGRRDSCPRAAEPVCGDGGPATEAWLDWVDGMAFGPDGSLYLGDWAARKLRRLRPDGVLEAFAGTGVLGFSGMGGPATAAQIGSPMDADVGPDGSVYIPDQYYDRVYRVTPDGIINVFAGNGQWSASAGSGDGGPATAAPLSPVAVAVGPDGGVYVVDRDNHRIRRVGPDGTIHTVVGTGVCGEDGDGGPATAARLCYPSDITFGPDGSLYISDSPLIRKVAPDGTMSTIAGYVGSPDCFSLFYDEDDPTCGEGRPATQVPLYGAADLDVGPDGNLYFAHRGIDVVRRIESDGTVRTLAGIGSFTDGLWCNFFNGRVTGDPECGNGSGARQVEIRPTSVLVGPDGKLYVNDDGSNLVRRVGPAAEGYSDDRFFIPSGDGSQLFVFTGGGRHLETRDALTGVRVHAFAYDVNGLLTGVTDAEGKVTTVERAPDGTPLAVVGPYGERTTLALDAYGWLSGITDPAGRPLSMNYTPEGLLSSLTDPRGGTSIFDYLNTGHLWRDRDAAGGFQRLERFESNCRTSSGRYLYGGNTGANEAVVSCVSGSGVRVTTAEGRTTAYWEHREGDRIVRDIVTPDGVRSRTEELGVGGTVLHQPDGTTLVTSIRRDPRWGMQAPGLDSLRVTLPSGLTSRTRTRAGVVLADPHDPMSLLVRTDSVVVNGRLFTDTYDATLRQRTARSPEGRVSVARLDSLGRPVEQVEPERIPIQGVYDALGRVSQRTQGNRTWSYDYDAAGRLASVTDPLQRASGFAYDSVGRMVSQTLPDGRALHFTYDAKGNLTSVTPPGRPAHVFEYSSVDLVEGYEPPAAAGSGGLRYRYNLDRDLVQVIRPDSQTVDLGYDGAGRLSTVIMPGRQLQYGYDATTGLVSSLSASDSSALAYTYDGTLPLSVAWTGTVSGTVGSTWNENFWLTSQTVNGAHAVDFRYDRDGLLTGAGALQLTRSAASGMLTASTLGQVTQSIGYDGFGELAADTVRSGGAVIFARGYTRDASGRIASLTETVAGATTGYAFVYDSIGRLAQVTRDGVAVESYEWDANGNRTRAVTAGGVTVGTVDAQDRLLTYGSAAYGYSPTGDLETMVVGSDTTRYRYDAVGNLREVRLPGGATLEYLVDPRNRRVGRRVNGVLDKGFLYQGLLSPVAELDGAGNVVSRFVYGTRENVPEFMVKGGVTYRLVTDHLGSVRLVVNTADGEVAQRMDYDSWGNVILDSNPGFQPFGYAGGLYEAQTGLTRFGARDYDARTGRWTARDPILFNGGSSNLYAYVLEDPVNGVDPDGLQPYAPPPSNIPGGPWTWSPNPASNNRAGAYMDPRGSNLSWELPDGHWDLADGPTGTKTRYDRWGNEISAFDAHNRRPRAKDPIDFEKRQKGPRGGGRGPRALGALSLLFDILSAYCAEKRAEQNGTSPWYEMLADMGAVPPSRPPD